MPACASALAHELLHAARTHPARSALPPLPHAARARPHACNPQAVLPRLRVHASKARLREIKASLLEQALAAAEEKLDVAAAMGWEDEEEREAERAQRCVSDRRFFARGAAVAAWRRLAGWHPVSLRGRC